MTHAHRSTPLPLPHSPPVCASNLFVAMASISSINIMAGAFSLASRKTSLTIRGPSPRYFCTNSEPTTRMKAAARRKRRTRGQRERTPTYVTIGDRNPSQHAGGCAGDNCNKPAHLVTPDLKDSHLHTFPPRLYEGSLYAGQAAGLWQRFRPHRIV